MSTTTCCLVPYFRRRRCRCRKRRRLVAKLTRALAKLRLVQPMRRRRMCVEPKDQPQSESSDRVVSAIIGYFTARVIIQFRAKPIVIEKRIVLSDKLQQQDD